MEVKDFETELANLSRISCGEIYADLVSDFEQSFVGTYAELVAKKKSLKAEAEKEYRNLHNDYCKKRVAILEKFEEWLSTNYGTDNPDINHVCYTWAWESGHSCGFSEITNYYEDYIEFAQDIIDAYKKENK